MKKQFLILLMSTSPAFLQATKVTAPDGMSVINAAAALVGYAVRKTPGATPKITAAVLQDHLRYSDPEHSLDEVEGIQVGALFAAFPTIDTTAFEQQYGVSVQKVGTILAAYHARGIQNKVDANDKYGLPKIGY